MLLPTEGERPASSQPRGWRARAGRGVPAAVLPAVGQAAADHVVVAEVRGAAELVGEAAAQDAADAADRQAGRAQRQVEAQGGAEGEGRRVRPEAAGHLVRADQRTDVDVEALDAVEVAVEAEREEALLDLALALEGRAHGGASRLVGLDVGLRGAEVEAHPGGEEVLGVDPAAG